ncbi:MAG TPA: anti-sigma factor antagonist [Roseiflexaceae bacterium]|nr:anti-sigma factor antagonist [Roseiflexaceae bacterium]HMP41134.1 anti-sigma factor antagonist [Roseiflexaceae bacterium]
MPEPDIAMQSLKVSATLSSLALISDFISNATTSVGLDEHAAWQVQLAVDEAATNIIQHGYDADNPGQIELTWDVDGVNLVVTLRDFGRRFNPFDVPPPDLVSPLEERQPGGLGLYLMSRLMDDVAFSFDDVNGNLLTMTKRLRLLAGAVRVFALSGRIDAVTTAAALEPIYAAVEDGNRYVLINMAEVSFLSSSGLRALLLVRKHLLARDGELRLCSLQPQVYEVFVLTGFTQVFSLHVSQDDALAAFGQGAREP